MNNDPDSGDVARVLDETGLRLMFARQAIRGGRIPARPADRLSKGQSDGARCAICEMPLLEDELGCKLEFAQNGREWTSHSLHIKCFSAWEYECRDSEKAGRAANGHGRRNDDFPAGNGHDSDSSGRGPA